MLYKITNKISRLIIALLLLSTPTVVAQSTWQKFQFSIDGQILTKIKAIEFKTNYVYNNEKRNAHIIIYGRESSGYINIGIVLNNFDDVFTEKEIDQFRPPDISDKIAYTDAIYFISNKNNKTFSSPMILTNAEMLPKTIKENIQDYFSTNIKSKDQKRWKLFLGDMSDECVSWSVKIGGILLKNSVKIEFTNNGLTPLLKELITSVIKK